MVALEVLEVLLTAEASLVLLLEGGPARLVSTGKAAKERGITCRREWPEVSPDAPRHGARGGSCDTGKYWKSSEGMRNYFSVVIFGKKKKSYWVSERGSPERRGRQRSAASSASSASASASCPSSLPAAERSSSSSICCCWWCCG